MGWDVGTTGTNLGQLAICSWTFRHEEMCALIFASVTCEMREAELGRLVLRQQRQRMASRGIRLIPSALRTCRASEQQPTAGASGRDPGEEEITHKGTCVSTEPHRHSSVHGLQGS